MLKPIPSRILRHTVTLHVPLTVDAWENVLTQTDYTVKRVCVQPTHNTQMTRDNTEVSLNAVLFVDKRISAPPLDWEALQDSALSVGTAMTVTYGGRLYTVMHIDALVDDNGNLHHYEVGLL